MSRHPGPPRVGGADQGLRRVGEDRVLVATAGLLFATTEEHVRADADASRDLREGDGGDEARTSLGERSLVQVGIPREENDRHGLTEHRVPEELQTLVVRDSAVLVRV